MGNYPFLQIYRILLIVALVVGVLYVGLNSTEALQDFGGILPGEYIEVFLLPVLGAIGLLAQIQIIGAVIETGERQRTDHYDLLNRIKALTQQVEQLKAERQSGD
jgi:transposase